MPKKTKQQGTTEVLDEPRLQMHVNKDRGSVCQLNDTRVRAKKIISLPFRSESACEHASAIEWLSTSIVHDLRNPLGTIYAAAEMLMDVDPAPTQVKRLAGNIYRAARRMRELLADLTRVSDESRSTVEMWDIRDVIGAASEAASAATENYRVRILFEVFERIEVALTRPSMERAFFNLIVNALEAMPTGGELRILARKTGSCVLIELEDTGPGIPAGIRGRLFEPFATAGKQDGLGLGLALSRQTVVSHGGDIWTEPAAGARFVIRLPLNQVTP